VDCCDVSDNRNQRGISPAGDILKPFLARDTSKNISLRVMTSQEVSISMQLAGFLSNAREATASI
jgi:hypothetical protein